MKIIIATDIHGINQQLRTLFQDFGNEVTFLSPWHGDGSPYDNEQQAVAAFQADHGMEKYQQQIAKEAGNTPAILIGFSVGATALWRHIASELCHPQSRAHLYYGSRIRDHQTNIPRCQTKVIFAEHEASFQPADIVANITHPHVECSIIAGTHHGFMNPHSPNFREELARRELFFLQSQIEKSGYKISVPIP